MKKSNLLLKLGTITLCTSLLIGPTAFAKGNGRENRGDNQARAVYCQRTDGEAGVRKFDGSGNPDGNCAFDREGERKLDCTGRLFRENNPNRSKRLNSSSRENCQLK